MELRNVEVSTIIPAYNEQNNIANVLSVVKEIDELSDIIVVNDGSTDDTSKIAHSFEVKVIDLPVNKGKSHAMWTGFTNTDSPVILFLDADLVGLKPEQVLNLILPVKSNLADMSLGIFNSGRGMTDLAQKITPFLTGQRCVRRDILANLNKEDWLSGYGIEIVLTRYAKEHNLRIVEVPLLNVTHPMKEEKMGIAKGMAARLKMYWEIAKEFNRI